MILPPQLSTLFPTRRSSDLQYIEGRIAVNNVSSPALPEAAIVGEGEESYIFIKTGEASRQEESREDANDNSWRSEEHTSELQSRGHLVCRLLLEKKKKR